MCHGPMHAFLAAMPKCEHHMHLEGSLEPSLLFTLAARNNISLPPPSEDPSFQSTETLVQRYRRFTSLDDFLHYYFIGMSVLQTASDYESLAWAYFLRAHSEGVLHAECFFDPQEHVSRGVSYATVLAGFTSAQGRAKQELGLTSELIVCILRHLPASEGDAMYRSDWRPDLLSGKVKGLGLSSTEKGRPPSLYKSTFLDAESHGILRTAHAGEEADVSYMRSALEDCHVQRVDHGIKLAEDPELMAEFARRKILITMCPLSNKELHAVEAIESLPVRTYLENGVNFSLNSDDPAYFNGYILANYCAVQEAFKLSIEEWARIGVASIEGSWCKEERKDELLQRLNEVLVQFQ